MDFAEGMGAEKGFARPVLNQIQELVRHFNDVARAGSVEEALAAFYAYESQVPRIAAEKDVACGRGTAPTTPLAATSRCTRRRMFITRRCGGGCWKSRWRRILRLPEKRWLRAKRRRQSCGERWMGWRAVGKAR